MALKQEKKNNDNCPRVIVISHTVFSETANVGKTLSVLFDKWNSTNLAQIYLHSEVPNSKKCLNYFRITDFDILNSILKRKKPGTILNENDIVPHTSTSRIDMGLKAELYKLGNKRKPYMFLFRNFIWELNKWKTNKLEKWIDDFKPDAIFFVAGDYSFLYSLTLYVSRKRKIPIIAYFSDDYYGYTQKSVSPIYYLNRLLFKRKTKELFSELGVSIVICTQLGEAYRNIFGRESTVIMTGSSIKPAEFDESRIKISYIGNLDLDRWRALIDIGTALKDIKGPGIPDYIDVYSNGKHSGIIKNLTLENGIMFHGSLNSLEVEQTMKTSQILIHVESVNQLSRVKYSISTKIADLLSSGTCIFAYGPAEAASIEYLKQNDAACVVTSKDNLREKLRSIIKNKEQQRYYVKKAILLSSKNHNIGENSLLLKSIIEKYVKEFKYNR